MIKPRIYLSKEQIALAHQHFQAALPDQWGYYFFTEYLTELEACREDIRRMALRIENLEAENASLRYGCGNGDDS